MFFPCSCLFAFHFLEEKMIDTLIVCRYCISVFFTCLRSLSLIAVLSVLHGSFLSLFFHFCTLLPRCCSSVLACSPIYTIQSFQASHHSRWLRVSLRWILHSDGSPVILGPKSHHILKCGTCTIQEIGLRARLS